MNANNQIFVLCFNQMSNNYSLYKLVLEYKKKTIHFFRILSSQKLHQKIISLTTILPGLCSFKTWLTLETSSKHWETSNTKVLIFFLKKL